MDKSTAQAERKDKNGHQKMSFCHPKGGLLQDKSYSFILQKWAFVPRSRHQGKQKKRLERLKMKQTNDIFGCSPGYFLCR